MTYVVTDNCIKCKYTDCVSVCPADAFYEGPNFLAINPDDCIDCDLCPVECPADAIFSEDNEDNSPATIIGSTRWSSYLFEDNYLPTPTVGKSTFFLCPSGEPNTWQSTNGNAYTYGMKDWQNRTAGSVTGGLVVDLGWTGAKRTWLFNELIDPVTHMYVSDSYHKVQKKQFYVF